MISQAHEKITPSHLERTAYLYVRQSTLRQVMENTESTTRPVCAPPARCGIGLAHRARSSD